MLKLDAEDIRILSLCYGWDCEDGYIWCRKCETPCDHDRVCPNCPTIVRCE